MTKPSEAPTDGRKAKESKLGGQNFQMKGRSMNSFFVSWRQIISHLLSEILSLIEVHFLSELRPLTFQQRTFHDLKEVLAIIKMPG